MKSLLIFNLIQSKSIKKSKKLDISSIIPDNYDDSLFSIVPIQAKQRSLEPGKKSLEDGDGDGGNDIRNWVGEDINQGINQNNNNKTTNNHQKNKKFDPKISLPKNLHTIRIRPNIYDLTLEERNKLINAILKLNNGPRPTAWDQLTKLHILNYQYVHLQPYFFAWHRAFIFRMEELLREIDPSIDLPYWDWTKYHSKNPFDDPIFSPEFFGGDGNPNQNYCLTNGPFRSQSFKLLYDHDKAHSIFNNKVKHNDKSKLSIKEIDLLVDDDKNLNTLNNLTCLKRKFIPRSPGYMLWNTKFRMWQVESVKNPLKFWHYIERGGHGYVHNAVGSERATDPLFFVIHAFVDKIWFDWQNKNSEISLAYPVKKNHYNMNLNPFGVSLRTLLDPINNLGYGY